MTALAWLAYTAANKRANHSYRTHPTSACLGLIASRSGIESPCKAIGDAPDNLCRACRKTKETP